MNDDSRVELIYCIEVKYKKTGDVRVSNECYLHLEDVVNFIKSRGDKPNKEKARLIWESDDYRYTIRILTLKK